MASRAAVQIWKGHDVLIRTGDEPPHPGRVLADNGDGTFAVTWHGWQTQWDEERVEMERLLVDDTNQALCAQKLAEIRRIEASGAFPMPATGFVRHANPPAPQICEQCRTRVGRVTDHAAAAG